MWSFLILMIWPVFLVVVFIFILFYFCSFYSLHFVFVSDPNKLKRKLRRYKSGTSSLPSFITPKPQTSVCIGLGQGVFIILTLEIIWPFL